MLFHEKRKYVFISVPKTGTSAIERRLIELDEEVSLNRIKDAKGTWLRVTKHAPLREVKALLGENADQYKFIAFFRDPRELVMAKYNWYRNGWPYQKWRDGALPFFTPNRNWWKPSLAQRVLLARGLPFSIWLNLYPFKPNAHFVTNDQGELDVDFFGLFESLQQDVDRIFTRFGYKQKQLLLPKENVTKYGKYSAGSKLVDRVVRKRCGADLHLIEKWKSENSK